MVESCACFGVQEFKDEAEKLRTKEQRPNPRGTTVLPANAIGFLSTPDGPFGIFRPGDEEGKAYQWALYQKWKRKQQELSTTPRPTTSEPETNPEPDHKDEAASRPENKRHSRSSRKRYEKRKLLARLADEEQEPVPPP